MSADILARLDRIERKLDQFLAGDRPDFDPEVFSDPRDWTGEPCKGKKFSECSPEYLGLLASMYKAFSARAAKENALLRNGKPKAEWDLELSAAAKAWAKYNRFAMPVEEPF